MARLSGWTPPAHDLHRRSEIPGLCESRLGPSGLPVKSHDVCNNVTSRLIDQLAISNAGSTSLCSTTASMRAMVSGLK
jgi:hypothetical protein